MIILRSINSTRRHEFVALSELKQADLEKAGIIKELKDTLAEVKTLRQFLPICAKCNKVRDDEGYWSQIENYLRSHADVQFSHGICPNCLEELYGDEEWFEIRKAEKASKS